MAVNHYENFPVASLLLPANIREDVVHLYRFARAADDVADEGNASPAERLAELARFRHALILVSEEPNISTVGSQKLDDIFLPLSKTIHKHRLPLTPLNDLLCAFEQDTQVKRYRDEAHLLDYCRRSANPVGRLMLHLFGQTDEDSLLQSDAICTALQRINFLQDVAIDLRKQRVYLPLDALNTAGVTVEQIALGDCNAAWQELMRGQIMVCRNLMREGEPLGRRLKGRIALEIRLIVTGGLRILEKIEEVNFDVFNRRPTLNKLDWIRMLARVC